MSEDPTQAPAPAASSAPAWLRETFGGELRAPRRLRWGFTHESWVVSVEGRALVATLMDDAAAARSIVDRGPELARRLMAAGIPSPAPDVAASRPDLGVVVAGYVEGTPGIEAMDGEAGARLVGGIAGSAWARIGGVDPSGLRLDDLWARPAELRGAALGWLRSVEADLTTHQASVLRERVAAMEPLLEAGQPGIVHGDLVPVNLLLRNGQLAALLDLEAAHIGEPLLDPAWFSWILRYHHPELEAPASDAFARAAAVDRVDARTTALLTALPSIRILEILGRRPTQSGARPRWLDQLRASTEP